ncbi:MAG: hypothetical protein JO043_05525 [Candidatus Eremiobacteraeota bacterium]|nr:hypothetical protein [Candidatus Eremiobacteraeota bacterium]
MSDSNPASAVGRGFAQVLNAFKTRSALPEEELEELRTLLDTYDYKAADATAKDAGCDAEMANLRKTLSDSPQSIWWSDMALAEICLLRFADDSEIRSKLGSWRRRLHEVIGDNRFGQYIANAPNLAAPTTTPADVRADLMECIRSVYYFYALYGLSSRSRSEVTKYLFKVCLAIIGIQLLIALLFSWHSGGRAIINVPGNVRTIIEYLIATSAMAVLGSAVSVQRRLQDPSVDVDPVYRYIQTRSDRFGVAFVSPVFGALFGLIVYALVASKLVSTSVVNFNKSPFIPDGISDAGIVLIFGFIAGFAEQLVPDALTRIAGRALGGIAGDGSTPSAPPSSTSTQTKDLTPQLTEKAAPDTPVDAPPAQASSAATNQSQNT